MAAGRLGVAMLACGLASGAAGAVPAAELSERLEERLERARLLRVEDEGALEGIRTFYAARDHAPVWVDGSGLSRYGRTVLGVFAEADADGLRPGDYAPPALAGAPDDLAGLDPVEAELALSVGVVRYGRDLADGRLDPSVVDPDTQISWDRMDALTVLEGALKTKDLATFLKGFAPQSGYYQRLRQALAQYRAQAEAGRGWRPLMPGEALKPGMRDPQVAALRARLIATGDLAPWLPLDDADRFDPALEAAVRRFQARHGLDANGIVGTRTRAALAVPIERRIEQIILNMERARWMPDPGPRYVLVNLPDFSLEVVIEGDLALRSRVVVGTPYHRTPVFSDLITYIELNPYWNVPPSIAGREILPEVQKDPAYLEKEHMAVLSDWTHEARVLNPDDIDWQALSADDFPYKLRQEPGPWNALGKMKFMFPNEFDVYLHDTPARALFERSERGFSHGCIRVQKPIELARLLLRGQGGWDRTGIEAAIATGERQVVRFDRPVPVHITYLTAWAEDDGRIQFRDDVYGRDERLAEALGLAS